MATKSKSNKKGANVPAKAESKKAAQTSTDVPTKTATASEPKPKSVASTAKPKAATVKSAKPVEKKVAASAKPSTTQIIYELLDEHGLDKTTFEMADETVRRVKGASGFNKKCFSWYRNAWKKLQKS